ncbi:hypothetical protein M3A49_36820 [Paraburkholderia sp. CNPSo 3076]|uniref:hypothetical protein n=1 Tax=Paraburkholderia TaxID=1822464 RepID=UPI001FEBD294|nr:MULTISPECIES: hypothetical protein [Paraburkholderia]MCX5544948.1 hypothetical protein [Paraburkholderia sp. CNPSo 3076]
MDKIARVGVDLAKHVMQIHAVDSADLVIVRKAITRDRFVNWFANLEPCLVAMEACSAAHYWARKLRFSEALVQIGPANGLELSEQNEPTSRDEQAEESGEVVRRTPF